MNSETDASEQLEEEQATDDSNEFPSPRAARRILIFLLFPSTLMPMVSSMSRVALPIIRDDFGIQADMTAWVAVAFTLPFFILMPVYGRLSDGFDKRRLILWGVAISWVGTTMTLLARDLDWLMAGRAIQGVGLAGMMPLGMALLSTLFRPQEQGRALGVWSTVGPATGLISSLIAGFLIAEWGWRGAFSPPFLIGILAFFLVWKGVPTGPNPVRFHFLRRFDWGGVALLGTALIGLVFYLSSRAITGVEPLQDWRLLGVTLVLSGGFWWWEKRVADPFISFHIFSNRMFCRATFCASMRMVSQGGVGFLITLYLVDIHNLSPAELGGFMMISSAGMTLVVRLGGRMADRWSSRWPVMIGLLMQTSVSLTLARLPEHVSIWSVALAIGCSGMGAGFMQAASHRAVMGSVTQSQLGAAFGLYHMLRFVGSVVGTALSGVALQHYLDAALSTIEAYQVVFFMFAGFPALGVLVGFGLREPETVSK